jgi:DNA-binding MarR family transcriptional regulator
MAGKIDLRSDLDRVSLTAFEKRGGLDSLYAAVAGVRDWDLDLSDRVYEIYLSHVRHVVAARRDIAYFRTLSEHVLRIKDALKRSNPSLARRISVLEDLVDEALAALPTSDRPERSRKHVTDILKTLHRTGTMSRADLRRRHGLGDANTSRILRDLEEEGLIARWQCGRDVTVEITASGREELALALQRDGFEPHLVYDLDSDDSPEALASYVLARLSPARLADQTDEKYPVLFGRDVGATLARYCGEGEEGERKFSEVWERLIGSSLASLDKRANAEPAVSGRFRLAMMSLLQFYAREAADANALLVRRRCAGLRKSLLEVVLNLDRGYWADAVQTAGALDEALQGADMPGPQILLVGVSGYHEERIIGKLASDIFLLERGYDGLQLASSPWASDGAAVGVNARYNRRVGPPDVRLVNAASLTKAPPENWTVFRHLGYRAFARQAWLWRQGQAKATPKSVRDWIRCYFTSGEPDLGWETRPQRAWLCLNGQPVNYRKTEFPALLRHLRAQCTGLGSPDIPPVATGDPVPDDVFEQFLAGASDVLISGSIHDLLLEEYWTDHNRGFVKLLEKDDFADWYATSKVGVNFIKFADRMPERIKDLVHKLYVQVLAATIKIADMDDTDLRRALYSYVATILAPSHRENWNTEATDTRWSFAASLESVGRLLLEELEPCSTAPDGPNLRLVSNA